MQGPTSLRPIRAALAAVLLPVLASTAFPASADDDVDRPAVTLEDVEGNTHSGRLLELTGDHVKLAGESARRWPMRELVEARFADRPVEPVRDGAPVLLANGDRLWVQPQSVEESRLRCTWTAFPGRPPVEIPLETVEGFILNMPATRAARERLLRLFDEDRERSDVLILRNGDRLTGEFQDLDQQRLRLKTGVGQTGVDRSGIRAVLLNPDLISFPPVANTYTLATLTDGTRLTFTTLQLRGEGELRGQAAFGGEVRIPLAAVVSLQFFGERVVSLSGNEPASYTFRPYLSLRRPLKRDRNVTGGPLRLRGRTYARGLGVHSHSEVTYSLDGRFSRFQAVVGVDDAADGEGSVRFGVNLDGKRVWTSELLTGEDQPVQAGPVDVKGAMRMTLVVEYGDRGDIRDYADWCDPVLIGEGPVDKATAD